MKRQWFVVLGCTLGLSASISAVFYSTIPVFLVAMTASTGWSRTQVISGLTMATAVGILSSPAIGRLMDRFGPRRVIALSTIPFGLSLAAFKLVGANYAAYLGVAALVGLFGNCANTFVYLSFLPRWFDRQLGLSLSLAATGIGLGQALTPIIAYRLLHGAGWRDGFSVLGVGASIVTLGCVALLLRDRPTGAPAVAKTSTSGLGAGLNRSQAMHTITFWRLVGSVFLITAAVAGSSVSFVPLLVDRGVSPLRAAGLASLTGVFVLLGRLVTGVVLDRVAVVSIARAIFAAGAVGIGLQWFGGSMAGYAAAAALIGLALGAEGDVMAYAVRRAFGERAYGEIYSYIWAAFLGGLMVGPILMSAVHDTLGRYDPALVILGLCAVAAAVLVPKIAKGVSGATDVGPQRASLPIRGGR